VSVAGESGLWVGPAEIPADDDIGKLGQALAAGRHGERDELMASSTAAYSGLRWGELTALTVPQVDTAARVITVDRKVVEVAGHLYIEAPKNRKYRKYRKTIYPRCTPAGYPLAEKLAARIEAARAEQEAGTNPLGLIFPSPAGKHWRSSNFNRNVLKRAYLTVGWRDDSGNGRWTWHSLRHVFCTTALFMTQRRPGMIVSGRFRTSSNSAPSLVQCHARVCMPGKCYGNGGSALARTPNSWLPS
jgi:integrase